MKKHHVPVEAKDLLAPVTRRHRVEEDLPSPVEANDERWRAYGQECSRVAAACTADLCASGRDAHHTPGTAWATAANLRVERFKFSIDRDREGFFANFSPDECAIAATEDDLPWAIAEKLDKLLTRRRSLRLARLPPPPG
ncbi:hypothetical protein [Roseomonas sp. BN140053]|uniref:hypothetical protein n=1 Tax=Roseomonas sp. BN140053 TaxID=3391898 RepID=UPI0039E9624D